MFLKSFERRDRQIFTTSLILLILSVGLTVFDDWVYLITRRDLGDLEKIGEVRLSKQDVRRRYKVDFGWNPLKSKSEVYQGDSIFTGDGSEAVITTTSGEEITVAPNSLVVINSRKDSLSIDIGFGSVEGKVGVGKKLFIASNNSITEIASSGGRVKIDAGAGDQLVLNVLEGQIKVKSSNGETIVTKNDASQVLTNDGPKEIAQFNVKLITPMTDQRFRFQASKATEFRWASPKALPRQKIKISTRKDLELPVVDTDVTGQNYLAYGLPVDQKLYWQVLGEGGQSEIGEFWVLDNKPPYLIFPQQGMQFFFDPAPTLAKRGSDVELKWGGGSPTRRYEVQISQTAAFDPVLRTLKTESNEARLASLQQGEYYWRIRGLEFGEGPWSESGIFRVSPEPTQLLSPPRPEFDSQILILTKVHGKPAETIHELTPSGVRPYIQRPPEFVWSKVPGAEKYEFQLSNSKDFRTPIASITTDRNKYQWWNGKPGIYFWRIRSMGDGFKPGVFSAPKPVAVQMAAPIALSESSIVDEVPDELLLRAPPPPVDLKWNPTPFAKSYEVTLSDDPTFKISTRFITAQAKRTVQLQKPGKYFWKVRALGKNTYPISDPGIYAFEFSRVFKDPALSQNLIAISPKQGESLLIVGQGKTNIPFQWNKPFENAKYEIEIAYDMNFGDVAHRQTTNTNRYVLNAPLKSAIVYWRVRATTNDGSTPWTGANRFLVSYETTPFDVDTSEKLHLARLKAKDRQLLVLARLEQKLKRLREPAGAVDIQLETPLPVSNLTTLVLKPNFPQNSAPVSVRSLESSIGGSNFVKNPPLLSWEKVPAAERYFIEIANDSSFKEIVVKAPSFNPYFLWENVRPGQFYWRVQAFNDRYSRSDFSPVQKLRVEVEIPEVLSPDNFVEIFEDPPDMWIPPSPFVLEWSPRIFAEAYEVEFSESKDLSLSKTFRTRDSKHEFRVSKIGTYFWRVRPVNTYGVGISSWSPLRSVDVSQAQRSPASVDRLTGLFPKDRTMLFVGKGLMNLVFHFISPSSVDETIVEVSNRSDFKTILARESTSKGKFRLRKDLPEGSIYWRLRPSTEVRSPAEASRWSQIYQFVLRKESEPYTNSSSIED